MSISATSNYMSNAEIIAWMENKTDGMYKNMHDAMTGADRNADAEAALNKIKADIANCKTNGGDAAAIHDEVNAALAEYGDIPGVKDLLQPIADNLNKQYGTSDPVHVPPPPGSITAPVTADPNGTETPTVWNRWNNSNVNKPVIHPMTTIGPRSVKLTTDQVDAWTTNIGNTVDDLGKKDQLALINIQEFNSEINQAKQTASALMDAADKSANAIINHIA